MDITQSRAIGYNVEKSQALKHNKETWSDLTIRSLARHLLVRLKRMQKIANVALNLYVFRPKADITSLKLQSLVWPKGLQVLGWNAADTCVQVPFANSMRHY